MINCNCLNDWDYSLLVFNEVSDSYLTLWIDCHFKHKKSYDNIDICCCYKINHDAFMSVFYFIDTSASNHVDMFFILVVAWGQARSKLGGVDASILHHAFILIFIALWAVISRYVTILMAILSYFTRFTWRGRMPSAGILGWKRSKYWRPILRNSKSPETPRNTLK